MKVRRCPNPQCKEQLEIALSTIFALKEQVEESGRERKLADESLESYIASYFDHQSALRELVNLAIHDVGGRIYFRAEEAKKLMELAK